MQENDLRSIATRTDVLQKDFMKEVADLTTYNSMGSLNLAADILSIIAERINRGDIIINEETNTKLTTDSFKLLISTMFTDYVIKKVYSSITLKGKVYFDIENSDLGLDLVYTGKSQNKLFKWIADIDDEYSLVELIPTGVVYIRYSKTKQLTPFLSENNSCYVYSETDGKIREVKKEC